MSRLRIKKTSYHIKYVYIVNGRVVYRPYVKKIDLHENIKIDSNGRLKPPICLGKPGDDPDEIYRNYLTAKDQIKKQQLTSKNTLGWIVEQYEKSVKFKTLAASSQKRNKNLRKILEHPLKIDGKNNMVSNLHIRDVSKPLFHQLAEKRLDNYKKSGKKGSVQVNREITFVSGAISWATNHIVGLGISDNPLRGFEKFKEPKNERYVTDQEYLNQHQEAEHISDYLQPVFELTYLLATRGVETLDIRLSDCTDEGIRTHRRKGSKDNIIEWSDRLREAYNLALKRHNNVKNTITDPYLIIGFSGGKLTKSTLDDAMQRLKRRLKENGQEKTYWNLHLLKTKGISDSEDKNIAGHVSEQMKQLYDTKIQKRKAVK